LIGANEDLDSIPKQFISVDELLRLFANCENTNLEKSAQWLINNIEILNRTKKLILRNDYTLIEYEQNENDLYNCPITTIRLIAGGEDYDPFSDCVGFARYMVLMDLKSRGLDIDDNLIENSRPYISKICYEQDDNFYKNQLIYMLDEENHLIHHSNQKPNNNNENIPFIHFLDPNSPSYNRKFALLLRLHHDLVYVGRYEDKTKNERVEQFLEEYGENYGVTSTTTHATYYANLLTTRTKAKNVASEAVKKAFSDQS
jgi:hypothetical protein